MGCFNAQLTRIGGKLELRIKNENDFNAQFTRTAPLQAQFSLVCGTSLGEVLLFDSNYLILADSDNQYLIATKNN